MRVSERRTMLASVMPSVSIIGEANSPLLLFTVFSIKPLGNRSAVLLCYKDNLVITNL